MPAWPCEPALAPSCRQLPYDEIALQFAKCMDDRFRWTAERFVQVVLIFKVEFHGPHL